VVETGGGGAIAILVVLAFLGIGAAFIVVALRDEDAGKDRDPTFMTRANHPLRHVRVAINADRKKAREKAREAAPDEAGKSGEAGQAGEATPKRQPPKRTRRPDWLRRVR
jgi:hypothetical protein